MITFEQLFGRPASDFKNTIVLTPFLSKGLLESLGIEEMRRGNPFSSGHSEYFTLVHTQIGAPFVGDATLYLEETSAEHLIFWGACGAVESYDHLPLGALAVPTQTLNCESFSQLLQNTINPNDWAQADQDFLNQLTAFAPDMPSVRCASFGSFKLENTYYDFLIEQKIEVVEMETAAFFSAARKINKRALALFYVTDILNEKHVFAPMTPTQQTLMHIAQTKGAQLIQDFAQSLR